MPDPKITRLVSTHGTTRELELDDGSIIERSAGTVSWRNNNPGNLKFEFAGSADATVHNPRTHDQALAAAQGRYGGVVALDQWGNAIFDSYESGRAAKIQLLTRSHGEHTVEQLLPSYSRADYSGATNHTAQAAAIFAEGDRQGVDLRGKTVGQMGTQEREALADGIRRFEGWREGEVRVTREPTLAPTGATPEHAARQPSTPTTHADAAASSVGEPSRAAGHAAIYQAAHQHFFEEGRRYEYGRSDHPRPGRDSSRLERDNDGDGRLGVDCSAFVWRGLKDAGYDVRGQNAGNFTTHNLFNGAQTTPYAREHFDVVSAADARKPNGNLQTGDILMFSAPSGQHVGIFKGYDSSGNIQFIGSQGSTGPAEVTIRPNGYWDGGGTHIVGALRAKPEFQIHAPRTEALGAATPERSPSRAAVAPDTHHLTRAMADGALRHGERGDDVRALQRNLAALGVNDDRGRPLVDDSRYGDHTREAVRSYQATRGLHVDGIAGRETLGSIAAQLPHAKVDVRPAAVAQIAVNDPSHADHALYVAFRDRLPASVPDNAVAHVTAQAKQAGIDRADGIRHVGVENNTAFVVGSGPTAFRAAVDLNAPAPTMEQSSARLAATQEPQQQQLTQPQVAISRA